MEQVNNQRMLAAELQKTQQGVLAVDPGQEGGFLSVNQFAQAAAQQEKAQEGNQGEVVTAGEAGVAQTQPCKISGLHPDGGDPNIRKGNGKTQKPQGPPGQLTQQRP